jgi:glycosyltransferase involved in cell wall biosynthesis
VLPHAGGVEQFVETSRRLLSEEGAAVRVLACGHPRAQESADAVMPSRFLGGSGWPLPCGGWATLWREVGRADVVVANNSRHLLPVIAVLVARARGRGALLVLHGSLAGPHAGSMAFRLTRRAFERTLGRLAVRIAVPVSVSRAGVEGCRRLYGVQARHLPFPLPSLAPAPAAAALPEAEPLRIVWAGRLYPEKDPVTAVLAVEAVRRVREATLDVYGDGHLRPVLERLAQDRPWLRLHGAREWSAVQDAQGAAHACLSTSVADNVQVAVLEPLARGIPVVSTRVGDAPRHHGGVGVERFCVAPGDPEALAAALLAIAADHGAVRAAFAANGRRLEAEHRSAPRVLAALVREARR